MKDAVIFQTKDEFVAWIAGAADVQAYKYARILSPERLVLAPHDSLSLFDEDPESAILSPVSLPAAQDAAEWWESLMDGEIIDYWLTDSLERVVCAAKCAIWKPMNTIHAQLGVRHFRRISDTEFQRLVDRSTATEMWNEVRLVGLSIRRFSQ
jgi:hypothetical protein